MRETAQRSLPKGSTLVLYGSRARGSAKPGSDWDVLILLDKARIEVSDYDNVVYPFTALGWDLGEAIIPVIYTKKNWDEISYMPFYKNVEQDKVLIYES